MNLVAITPEDIAAIPKLGDLRTWSAATNHLFAAGCEAQSFALLASLATPLLSLWKEPCGAVVSIWGGRKSGKTTAYAAAHSVWGHAPHLALPTISETILNRDPGRIANIMRNFATTGNVLISLSGMSMFEAAGPANCGVEFKVAVPAGLIVPKDKNHIAYDLDCNSGHAGAAFLGYTREPEIYLWAKRQITSQVEGIREKRSLGSGFLSALRIIAASHVAGVIAVKLGLLEYEPERITAWVSAAAFGGSD